MLAPHRMAAYVSPRVLCWATYCLMAATARAPAGSTMLRVSTKMSLIAAQTASVSTVMNSSTSPLATRKVSSPTSFTAVPSENSPTSGSATRLPDATERAMASESFICTPTMRISGRTALM